MEVGRPRLNHRNATVTPRAHDDETNQRPFLILPHRKAAAIRIVSHLRSFTLATTSFIIAFLPVLHRLSLTACRPETLLNRSSLVEHLSYRSVFPTF